MVNAIIIIIIAWRRPTKGADLNREIRKDFQDAFNSLKYKSCVDTNNFYKYVFSIPIQLHDVNPSDEKVGSLRLELYNFINVFREGGGPRNILGGNFAKIRSKMSVRRLKGVMGRIRCFLRYRIL
jgi:hypothetical protein